MQENEAGYSDAVLKALDAGRKVEAIKILREETGIGLKAAKEQIDRLERKRHPDGNPLTESGGASSLIKLVLAIVFLIVVYQLVTGN